MFEDFFASPLSVSTRHFLSLVVHEMADAGSAERTGTAARETASAGSVFVGAEHVPAFVIVLVIAHGTLELLRLHSVVSAWRSQTGSTFCKSPYQVGQAGTSTHTHLFEASLV